MGDHFIIVMEVEITPEFLTVCFGVITFVAFIGLNMISDPKRTKKKTIEKKKTKDDIACLGSKGERLIKLGDPTFSNWSWDRDDEIHLIHCRPDDTLSYFKMNADAKTWLIFLDRFTEEISTKIHVEKVSYNRNGVNGWRSSGDGYFSLRVTKCSACQVLEKWSLKALKYRQENKHMSSGSRIIPNRYVAYLALDKQ